MTGPHAHAAGMSPAAPPPDAGGGNAGNAGNSVDPTWENGVAGARAPLATVATQPATAVATPPLAPERDTLTVIRARGRRLAKLIEAGGAVLGYDGAYLFDLYTVEVADLDALAALLARLHSRSDCAVVRAAVADPARVRGVRRLVNPCPETGERPTLRDVPRRWAALDFDDLAPPPGLDVRDLAGCGAVARAALPAPFRAARLLVGATGSHGVKPGLRLRVWAWLSRSTSGAELARWLRGCPVDAALFRPVQPIYTAAPVFAPGVSDPLPVRLAELPGADVVAVPSPAALAPPSPREPERLPRADAPHAGSYAVAALAGAVARVSGAGEGTRHDAVLAQARSLARLVEAGLLTGADVREALGRAAVRAGLPGEEAHAVVEWALRHPSTAELPEGVR